ncbi:MAG: HNH endonuclease [Candidatus Microthrix sp.]|nr:HNH endonuclease [Candidatus Microthrix sp.]
MRRPVPLDLYVSLAFRDGGWFCSYCHVLLVPVNDPGSVCAWRPEQVFWDHCGCGNHRVGVEPCILGAGWTTPRGWEWPQIDHVVPTSRGGSDDPSNLVLACCRCNSAKGALPASEFRRRLVVPDDLGKARRLLPRAPEDSRALGRSEVAHRRGALLVQPQPH